MLKMIVSMTYLCCLDKNISPLYFLPALDFDCNTNQITATRTKTPVPSSARFGPDFLVSAAGVSVCGAGVVSAGWLGSSVVSLSVAWGAGVGVVFEGLGLLICGGEETVIVCTGAVGAGAGVTGVGVGWSGSGCISQVVPKRAITAWALV